jgi:predicted DNA-binding transcriptional regulator AlpA
MDLSQENLDRLLTPREALEYLAQRYNIIFKLNSFYSMINRRTCPHVTRFRGLPRFKTQDIDAWVQNGGV